MIKTSATTNRLTGGIVPDATWEQNFQNIPAAAALGGLSITPTSLAIEAKLAAKKAAACGAPSCGCGG